MGRVQFGIYQMPAENKKGNAAKKAYARLISRETKKFGQLGRCQRGVGRFIEICRTGTVVWFLRRAGGIRLFLAGFEDF